MHNYCINKLLNLEDVIVKKVVHADTFVKIHLETNPKEHVCSCGKRFYESYSFLPRYFHRTSSLTAFIATSLHDTSSVSSIAKRCNVSTATANRILDTISFQRPTLSVLDILPSRSQTFLTSYFREIPKSERYQIKFFVCDLWQPYTDLAKT